MAFANPEWLYTIWTSAIRLKLAFSQLQLPKHWYNFLGTSIQKPKWYHRFVSHGLYQYDCRRTGEGRLGIIEGGGVALKLWGPPSKLVSSTWSNSLLNLSCSQYSEICPHVSSIRDIIFIVYDLYKLWMALNDMDWWRCNTNPRVVWLRSWSMPISLSFYIDDMQDRIDSSALAVRENCANYSYLFIFDA